jgi:hypothetical protein
MGGGLAKFGSVIDPQDLGMVAPEAIFLTDLVAHGLC